MKTINNTKEVYTLIGEKLKKKQIAIPSLSIAYDNKKLASVFEVSKTGLSRVFKDNECLNTIMVRDKSRVRKIKDIFTWKYLHLDLSPEVAQKEGKSIFVSTIYVVHLSNGWVKTYSDLGTNGRFYTSLDDGQDYLELPDGEVHMYKGLCWTASNKRLRAMICLDITNGDNRFELMDEATLGAMTILKEKYPNDQSKKLFMDIQKAMGYIGNVSTPSNNLGVVDNYAIYTGKWLNSTNESFLTEAYDKARKDFMKAMLSGDAEVLNKARMDFEAIKAKNETLTDISTQDGQMYVNIEEFAKMIAKALGVKLTDNAMNGIMGQVRPATIKASCVACSRQVFNSIVKGTKEMAAAKGQEVIIVGDEDKLLYIADKNCVKLDYDLTRTVTMEVLAFAKCSDGRLSKQMAESILFACERVGVDGQQLLYDVMEESIDNKMSSMTSDKKPKLLTPEEIAKDLDSGFINNIVTSTAPNLINESKALYNSTFRQTINSVTNSIDGLNGDLKSNNRRLSSDPTFIITGGRLNSIMNTGEVFINEKRFTKVIMLKYPKMGLREYYAAVNVSVKEIARRCDAHVKAGTINLYHRDRIVQFYKELHKSIAVLPAKSIIAYACAGLDFDYDGAVFVNYTKNPKNRTEELTNRIVEVLFESGMEAVVIQN